MPKTSKTVSKEIIDSIVENYKAFKRSIHTGLMVFLGIALILFIFTKSQQEETPTWVYIVFFAVITGILLRKFIPKFFPKGDPGSVWKKAKDAFVSKNYIIIFWRIVLLILIIPFLAVYLLGYTKKHEVVYVDTNPPAAQAPVPAQPSPTYTASNTMTYNAGERYYLNIPNEETRVRFCLLNTDEAYVTFYRYNTHNVAMRWYIQGSGISSTTYSLYKDGGLWPGEYQFVFDRDVVIQIKK